VQSKKNNHTGTLYYIHIGDKGSEWKAWVARLERWLCTGWDGRMVKLHDDVKGRV